MSEIISQPEETKTEAEIGDEIVWEGESGIVIDRDDEMFQLEFEDGGTVWCRHSQIQF